MAIGVKTVRRPESGTSYLRASLSGMMIIPALALIFLIVSFFAKVPGGIAWAAYVLLAVVVQVALGDAAVGDCGGDGDGAPGHEQRDEAAGVAGVRLAGEQ